MRLQETVSLGEKRIVALLEIDGRRFLVGGGSSGVSLLAQLDTEKDFSNLVRQRLESH
jgi:flagellar biogenesis protein FliO